MTYVTTIEPRLTPYRAVAPATTAEVLVDPRVPTAAAAIWSRRPRPWREMRGDQMSVVAYTKVQLCRVCDASLINTLARTEASFPTPCGHRLGNVTNLGSSFRPGGLLDETRSRRILRCQREYAKRAQTGWIDQQGRALALTEHA